MHKAYLYIFFTFNLLTFAQGHVERSFSSQLNESDLVIKATSIAQSSFWKTDSRGKHIYTKTDFRIDEILKGDHNSQYISLEMVGGSVNDTTEVATHSYLLRNNQEMILMLKRKGNFSEFELLEKINIIDNKIYLYDRLINADNFISLIRQTLEGKLKLPEDPTEIRRLLNEVDLIIKEIEDFKVPGIQLQKKSSTLAVSNLSPYKPLTWSAQIVVSTTSGNNTDVTTIKETDKLYIDWAVANYGPDDVNNSFLINLYIDNVLTAQWNASGLPAGYYVYVSDYQVDPLSNGNHAIKITVDPNNAIPETDETDNDYTKNIFIEAVAGLPTITNISPSSASAGTNSVITITGNNFGATRGASKVEFFYAYGQPKIESTNYLSWSNTSIECVVPIAFVNDYPASASSGPVSVTTALGSSVGYNFSVTFSYGAAKWSMNPALVPFRINQNTNDLTGEGDEIIAAASNWSGVGAQFGFYYNGTTTLNDATFDGYNDIMWGSTSGSLATTYYWSVGNSIIEVDMVFNDAYNWSKDGSQFDVQSVALHEFGHWLNLRDIYGGADSYKIMYGYSNSGVLKRNLTTAEVDGIKWIYGAGTLNLNPPILSSPNNLSNNIELNPVLNWNRVVGSNVVYRIQVSTNSNFNSILYDVSNLTNTQYQLNNLLYNTTYYWRVNASNTINGTSNWSEVWSFNTIPQTFTIITSSNPAQGGITSGGGIYNSGTQAILTAMPNSGYYFVNWTEGVNIVSTNQNYSFIVNSNRNFVANFDLMPSISVIKPNGGETWQEGSTQEITWHSINVNNVVIEYSINNGTTWNIIVNSIPSIPSKYEWTLPNTITTEAIVKISSVSNHSINDISDNIFAISPIPTLTLIQPNGGENWQRYSQQEIQWNSVGVQNIKIEFSTNNGTTWIEIISSTSASSGKYNWTTPNIPTRNAKVKISVAENEALSDISENVFTIGPIPSLTLLSPNGGENWLTGVPNSITWNSENISNIKIEYTTNNGVEWITITNSTLASTNIYNWLIPRINSTHAKIRISDLENFVQSTSNNFFNIVGVSHGDVFEDGEINGIDAALILRYVVGLSYLTTRQQYAADVNLDSSIQAYDAYAILYYILNGTWP